MNNDLIKRIAVCDMLHDEISAWGSCADEIEALLKANDALWEIPSVDAVEVVRCKDCDRRNKSADLTDTVYCRWFRTKMRKTDFCSYGERREDG